MKAVTVSSSELGAAGTWLPSDFVGGDPKLGCHLCGLSPVEAKPPRKNPRTTLLELDGPNLSDPLRRSLYRCVDREACERRRPS